MRISRKGNKCYVFRSSAKESQATLCTENIFIMSCIRNIIDKFRIFY